MGVDGQVREVIAGALRRLPATADMLYLEYCYDECKAVMCGSVAFVWMRDCCPVHACKEARIERVG
jgi:hypothetical protein